jgi:nicotinamidase-related amidase
MQLLVENSTLLLVDLQQKLLPAIDRGEAVVAECLRLAKIARLLDVPVFGTEQSPSKLGPNVEEIRHICGQTIAKTHFDACADGLLDVLPAHRNSVVVAGCEAHVCMLQTALGLLAAGYQVWIAIDAVGSRQESSRQAALERLRQSGAKLVTTEMVAFEWLRHAEHPRFREVLSLIK